MNSSTPEDSELADVIGKAKLRPSSSTEKSELDSAPSSELPLQPLVQRIGSMSIPIQGWSLLRVEAPDAVILHVGAEQLRVSVAGHWEPEEPERYLRNPPERPQPQPGETHIAYAQRYLEWSAPCRTNLEWMKWNGRKKWIGQTVEELRDLLESDQSVPNNCFLINP